MHPLPFSVRARALAFVRPTVAPFLATFGLGLAVAFLPVSAALAFGAPESFAELSQKVSPAVVNITTTAVLAAPTDEGPMVPEGSPFEEFFRDFQERNGLDNGQPEPRLSEALGSGFVISADGFIVTNNHVIEGADQVEIEFYSGERLEAKVIGRDPKTDIALLKVESEAPLPFVSFGDSDKMQVGDWVLAVGNPLGQGFSVSAGIVSARGRELQGTYDDFLQTDAAINKGNSGGPLFNMEGQVIGVNTAILSPTGGSIGIGFAMASNVVSKVAGQLQKYGETRRGWLGVKIQDVTPDVAEAMGLATARGALVTDVFDGPSKDAGVLAGDVILSFGGVDVADTRELVRNVADAAVGDKVPVVIERGGKTQTITVVMGRREEAEPAVDGFEAAPAAPLEPTRMLGLDLTPLTPELAQGLGMPEDAKGLAIAGVDVGSAAFAKGIREGDVITEAGQVKVTTVEEFTAQVTAAKDAGRKSILLLVRRGGDPRFVALPVE